MGQKKLTIGMLLSAAALILMIVGVITYNGVLHRDSIVYYLLTAAAVVIAVGVVLEFLGKHHAIFNLLPGICAVLVAVALGLAFQPMVQQIAWSYAGLDSMDVIHELIVFEILSGCAWFALIIATFTGFRKT